MSATFMVHAPRQSTALAAALGLHAVFILLALGSFDPRHAIETTRISPISVLPPVPRPLPREAPPRVEPAEYDLPRLPLPTDVVPASANESASGIDVPQHPDFPLGAAEEPAEVEREPPSLRTHDARVTALIDACYPAISRRRGEAGRITVLVAVDAKGRSSGWSLAQGSGFDHLDRAASCVVERLEFHPGRLDGRAVESQVRLPIVFRLD